MWRRSWCGRCRRPAPGARAGSRSRRCARGGRGRRGAGGRWLRAVWLHEALRDAPGTRGTTHGGAAADRAAQDGESDRGVLDAVRYHSSGYAGWDDVGKMLYLADFLEPGRRSRRKQRAKLAKRVPHDRDGVLREVVALQVRSRLRAGRTIHPLTVEFWNSLAER